MKITKILLAAIVLMYCGNVRAQNVKQASDPKMKAYIDALMKKMTLDEKIGQLNLPGAGDITTGNMKSSNIDQKIYLDFNSSTISAKSSFISFHSLFFRQMGSIFSSANVKSENLSIMLFRS